MDSVDGTAETSLSDFSPLRAVAWIPVRHFRTVSAMKIQRQKSQLVILLTDYRILFKHETRDFVADFKALNPKLSGTDERILQKITETMTMPEAMKKEDYMEETGQLDCEFERIVTVQRIRWQLKAQRIDEEQIVFDHVISPLLTTINALQEREKAIWQAARVSGTEGKLQRALVNGTFPVTVNPFESAEFRQEYEELWQQMRNKKPEENNADSIATNSVLETAEPATDRSPRRKRATMIDEPPPPPFLPSTRTQLPPEGPVRVTKAKKSKF